MPFDSTLPFPAGGRQEKGFKASGVTGMITASYFAALSAVVALVTTVTAMAGLRPIAYLVDLLDKPGGHKTHNGAVPLVGGLAMLFGIVVGIAALPPAFGSASHFMLSASLLVLVGLFDDRFTLSPKMRLLAQFASVLPMVLGAGIYMHNFGDLFGTGDLTIENGRLVATAIVTMAAINAFNMLDGLDGLAGGLTLVALVAVLALGTMPAGSIEFGLAAVLAGSVCGFLVFNVPVRANRNIRCFMGDAGSTLLGFSVAWLAMKISQSPGSAVSAITTVWLVAVPATDLLWTVIRRISRGRSPLYPDNEHLHHLLLRAGFGVRAVFAVMFGTAIAAAALGLALHHFGAPDWLSMLCLVGVAIAIVVSFRASRRVIRLIPSRFRRDELSAPVGSLKQGRVSRGEIE